MFSSLHGLLRETPGIQEHVSFEIASDPGGISFYIGVPVALKEFVVGQIYAQYPDAEIRTVDDYTKELQPDTQFLSGAVMQLSKDEYVPIRTFRDFEVDPLAAITGSLSELQGDSHVWWQLLVRPVPDDWQEAGHEHVAIERGEKKKPVAFNFQEIMKDIRKESAGLLVYLLKSIFIPQKPKEKKEDKKEKKEIEGNKKERLSLIESKLTKLGFATHMRVVAAADSQERADDYVRRVMASFRQYTASHINGFKGEIADNPAALLQSYRARAFPPGGGYVLNTEELASIYHFPNETVETPAISWAPAKHNEPPLSLPIDDCTFFGRTTYRDHLIKFGIKEEDRRRHMYLIGKTGVGKSTVFKTMIKQDMEDGKGLAVIDPHGDLIDELLEMVPNDRIEDVVLFDPSDTERPVSLNMLEANTDDVGQRNLLASGFAGCVS